jgi:hypothetical protein
MVSETKQSRPLGLYVLLILQLVVAVLLALYLMGLEEVLPFLRMMVRNPLFSLLAPGWLMVGMLLLAVLGMLLQKRWGWVLSMIVTGLGLAFAIWSYFQGTANYLPMLIDVVIVFYLNQRDVQKYFENSRGQESIS